MCAKTASPLPSLPLQHPNCIYLPFFLNETFLKLGTGFPSLFCHYVSLTVRGCAVIGVIYNFQKIS